MRGRSGTIVAGAQALLAAAAVAGAGACSHAWDALEPLSTSSSSSSGGTGGHGGTGGAGGSGGSPSTTSSSSTSSSTGTGGGGPVTHCAGTNLLSWDFSSEQPQVFGKDPGTDLTGGVGSIPLQDNASSWYGSSFWTGHFYDLRNDRISLEVTEIPNQSVNTWAALEVDYTNDDDLFIGVNAGSLKCAFDRGGNRSVPGQVPYDPVAHRHWQLREDNGTIHCEASPDGQTWTEIGAFDLAASLLGQPSAVQVLLTAWEAPQLTAPGTFRFDNLNGARPPTGSWCKADTFSDDFSSSTVPGPGWLRSHNWGDGDSYDLTGGQLNLHFGSGNHSDVAYVTTYAYDLTGERVALQVVDVPATLPGDVYFSVANAGNVDVYWRVTAGGFECAADTPSGWQSIWMGQAPTLPAWIGLSESGGKISCDIYQNGAWKPYGSLGGVVDPKRADIYIGAYQDNGAKAGGYTATFDNYNLGP